MSLAVSVSLYEPLGAWMNGGIDGRADGYR